MSRSDDAGRQDIVRGGEVQPPRWLRDVQSLLLRRDVVESNVIACRRDGLAVVRECHAENGRTTRPEHVAYLPGGDIPCGKQTVVCTFGKGLAIGAERERIQTCVAVTDLEYLVAGVDIPQSDAVAGIFVIVVACGEQLAVG
jgi:hypothetical protein